MLYLFVMKVGQAFQYLFGVKSDDLLVKVAIVREDVGQTWLHLLQINAEKLIQQLATVELYYVFVL